MPPRCPSPSGRPRDPRPFTAFLPVFAAALLATCHPYAAAPQSLTFERDIRPVLKEHCFDCHGETDKPKGGLDLRLRRTMVQGGDSGPAIVPGDPARSHLLELVRSGDMPKRERKLTPAQITLLERWIASGANTARPEPDTVPGSMLITPEERLHWAFQPVRRPPIPKTKPNDRARNAIDAFLLAQLRPAGLEFAPDADKVTLLRRACLDLTGLSPTPEETAAFLADSSPDAYERLVDRLLESPRYGERWGRHWLDTAGYADSDGYTSEDPERPYAYKYRDYVIRSLNTDKPFDRFLLEQLAGDELLQLSQGNSHPVTTNATARDLLVATGYLRMGADGTGTGGVDPDTARNQVLADTIKIVSTSLLGLSVGCAQCHDHRYDPISHVDYHRLRAVFEPAYNPRAWRSPAERLVSLYTDEDRRRAAEVEAEAQRLARERDDKQKQYLADALEKHLEKFDPALRQPLREAYHAPADKRTPDQQALLKQNPSVNIHPGVLYQYNPKAADDLKAIDARIQEIRSRRPPEDFLHVLTEPAGPPPVTHRLHRGDPRQPREAVPPGKLAVLAADSEPLDFPPNPEALPTSGRRLALARWLTQTNHPLVSRVLVNRVWLHHFGRGLVPTPADFGTQGERPTHPDLLDWLASVFTSPPFDSPANPGLGWSLKRLHRLILTSTAYQQASQVDPLRADRDPDNRLYSRKSLLRLDAEALRDSLIALSGDSNFRMSGPPIPVREDLVGQIVVGIDRKQGDNKMPVDVPMHGEEYRRSVYIQARRSRPLAFLNSFDAPVMEVNCERRQSSTVAPQALMLMNSDFILHHASRFAARLARETDGSPLARIERAWQLAFSRPPTEHERALALDFLRRQTDTIAQLPAPTPGAKDPPESSPRPDQPFVSLCQVLLSANELLYVD